MMSRVSSVERWKFCGSSLTHGVTAWTLSMALLPRCGAGAERRVHYGGWPPDLTWVLFSFPVTLIRFLNFWVSLMELVLDTLPSSIDSFCLPNSFLFKQCLVACVATIYWWHQSSHSTTEVCGHPGRAIGLEGAGGRVFRDQAVPGVPAPVGFILPCCEQMGQRNVLLCLPSWWIIVPDTLSTRIISPNSRVSFSPTERAGWGNPGGSCCWTHCVLQFLSSQWELVGGVRAAASQQRCFSRKAKWASRGQQEFQPVRPSQCNSWRTQAGNVINVTQDLWVGQCLQSG